MPPTVARTDHALERLIFFSDAVFAIAITLLVIDIRAPSLPRSASDSEFWLALARLIPNFVSFAISFAVIGAFWAGHHRCFMLARKYDARILFWNLALLGAVAFIPFVTAFSSANAMLRVPEVVYCGWILVTALLNMRVVRIVLGAPMVDESVPREAIVYVRRRSESVALGAAVAVGLSLVVPMTGQTGLITIPLWRWVLGKAARAR